MGISISHVRLNYISCEMGREPDMILQPMTDDSRFVKNAKTIIGVVSMYGTLAIVATAMISRLRDGVGVK